MKRSAEGGSSEDRSAGQGDFISRQMRDMAREDAESTQVRPPDVAERPARRPPQPLDPPARGPVDQPRMR